MWQVKNRPFWIVVGVRSLPNPKVSNWEKFSLQFSTLRKTFSSRFDWEFNFSSVPTGLKSRRRWKTQSSNCPRRRSRRRTLRLEKKVGLKKKKKKKPSLLLLRRGALGQSLPRSIVIGREGFLGRKKGKTRTHTTRRRREEIQIFFSSHFTFSTCVKTDPTKSSAKWTIDRPWRVSLSLPNNVSNLIFELKE